MRALLLAAGLGRRLRPLTDVIPKCLVPIRGRPLLGYWLDMLLGEGVARVLVNTHYKAETVRAFINSSPWRDRVDIAHEPELLGTGGTVLHNRAWFDRKAFMVIHADNLSRFPVQEFISRHQRRPSGTIMTMMTFYTDDPTSCGIVELDERSVVQHFHEKVPNPPGRLANGAVYIFEPEIMDYLAGLASEVIDLSTDVIPALMGRIATYHNEDYHRDIGTVDSLHRAEAEFSGL
jgi:mannose-1-phosphate guanylyltransferase